MRKNNRGITLIALVITIIVLLILAGVSINVIFGNEGLLERAKQAKKVQEKAEVEEELQLAVLGIQVVNVDGFSMKTIIVNKKMNSRKEFIKDIISI